MPRERERKKKSVSYTHRRRRRRVGTARDDSESYETVVAVSDREKNRTGPFENLSAIPHVWRIEKKKTCGPCTIYNDKICKFTSVVQPIVNRRRLAMTSATLRKTRTCHMRDCPTPNVFRVNHGRTEGVFVRKSNNSRAVLLDWPPRCGGSAPCPERVRPKILTESVYHHSPCTHRRLLFDPPGLAGRLHHSDQ